MKCNYKPKPLTKSELNKVTQKATNDVFELLLAIPVSVLHDKFGFGKKRCTEFTEKVLDLFDSYNRGYITIEDLREILWEEAGVNARRIK